MLELIYIWKYDLKVQMEINWWVGQQFVLVYETDFVLQSISA